MYGDLTYAAVTPARDEAENLERLGAALAAQSAPPAAWIVVDNGSRDETQAVVERFARTHPWARLVSAPAAASALPGAPVVRAFHAGLAALGELPGVVVKLDADVSFDAATFARVLAAFEDHPRLGIAGGLCLEQAGPGEWRGVRVADGHVRGALRAYRAACLRELLPLEERMGWDTIDEVTAAVLGWRTATLAGVAFRHHRRLGERDGAATARWRAQGEGAHYVGYRFGYLLLRTLRHAPRDPAAFAMTAAYLRSALARRPRHDDARVRAAIRRDQALSRLILRRVQRRGASATAPSASSTKNTSVTWMNENAS